MLNRSKLFLLLLVITYSGANPCFADGQYQVMYIHGQVVLEKNNSPLKVGDAINKNDKLKFMSKDAFVDVFILDQGRVVLRPPQSRIGNTYDSEVLYLVSSIVASKKITMSTRGGVINNVVELRKVFSHLPYLLLDGKSVIKLNSDAFPMNKNRFFFASYSHKDKLINKPLGFKGDKLIISFADIFSLDGKMVNEKKRGTFKLSYYDASKEEQTEIGTVEYYWPDSAKLKNEIGVMVKMIKQTNYNAQNFRTQVSTFLVDRYGYVSDDDVNRLLNEIL